MGVRLSLLSLLCCGYIHGMQITMARKPRIHYPGAILAHAARVLLDENHVHIALQVNGIPTAFEADAKSLSALYTLVQ